MKQILIAIACSDQKVSAQLAHMLCELTKYGIDRNVNIQSVFFPDDAMFCMSKNEVFNLAHCKKHDAVLFMPSDIQCCESVILDVLLSDDDAIAIQSDQNDTMSMNFLKLSEKVVNDLWESNVEVNYRETKVKNICEHSFSNGIYLDEGTVLYNKIIELGYQVRVNVDMSSNE